LTDEGTLENISDCRYICDMVGRVCKGFQYDTKSKKCFTFTFDTQDVRLIGDQVTRDTECHILSVMPAPNFAKQIGGCVREDGNDIDKEKFLTVPDAKN